MNDLPADRLQPLYVSSSSGISDYCCLISPLCFCLACFLSLCLNRSCSSLIRLDFCMRVMMMMKTMMKIYGASSR